MLVRVSAVVVGILIVAFFLTIIHNTSVVNDEVKRVKDGPYPVSVAAGHIETHLVHLEAIVSHISTTPEGSGPPRDGIRTEIFDVIAKIQAEIGTIDPILERNSELYERFIREFNLLESRVNTFASLCWSDGGIPATQTQITNYANNYLYPVIDYLLDINADTLEKTGYDVEKMYDSVTTASSTMLVFSIIMLISVIAMLIVCFALMHTKTKLENELRESLEKALHETREANEAKSAFLSNMSHDIRTPMNAIIGLTAIANENIDDKMRVKQCLTRISTSSQHLLSLINDVLDMNKIESGKVTLTEEEFSLSDVISEIEAIMQSQPASARLHSEVRLENVRNDLLIGDTMRLRQILLNLTSNAIKYTNEGDTVELIAREEPQTEDGRANVTFIVSDTGIGMESSFLRRIFEPFERERNDFTIFTEGTGLGMAITKNIVDLMGGTIKVESELGIGTVVRIKLSFVIADKQNEHHAKAMGEAHSTQRSVKRKPVVGNVLVVEDNDINMEIAQTIISERGATVDGAIDGLEAVMKVEKAPDGTYDLIFMDWQMPHMNGIEATKAIRRYLDEHGRKQIPIVAMTANAFTSDREEALNAGMNDFMAKPINLAQLDEILHKYLDRDFSEEAREPEQGDELACGDEPVQGNELACGDEPYQEDKSERGGKLADEVSSSDEETGGSE